MARRANTPISVTDLAEYLASQDDFALELFAYSEALRLGFAAEHGGTYEDPITKKPRQFDVRAHCESLDRRLDIAIECKSLSTSFPLLVSRIPRSNGECFHELVFSYDSAGSTRTTLLNLPPAQIYRQTGERTPYKPGDLVGKSTVQVGRDEKGQFVTGDQDVYDKWAQALASVSALVPSTIYRYKQSERSAFLSAMLPVLVVSDGALWVADYTADGRLTTQPQSATEVTLFVGRKVTEVKGLPLALSHLHICTKSELPRLLTSCLPEGNLWSQLIPPVPAVAGGA